MPKMISEMPQCRPYVSMVDTKITYLTRFQFMFYTFFACLWLCDCNYVGLLATLLVVTISVVPENGIHQNQFQEKFYTYITPS